MKNKMIVAEGNNIYCWGVYGIRLKDSRKYEDYLYIGSGQINDRYASHGYFLKRTLYEGTNKAILQKYYDLG
jgi:hypothetical protein